MNKDDIHNGRLKLRFFSHQESELIVYNRKNKDGVMRFPFPQPISKNLILWSIKCLRLVSPVLSFQGK